MFNDDYGGQSAARGKFSSQSNATRLDFEHEIVQNAVGHIFIKNTLVTKILKIQFQAFKFDAFFIGHIAESHDPEIGLAGFWTDGSEFGAFDFDSVISIGELIFKRFEILTELGWHVLPLPKKVETETIQQGIVLSEKPDAYRNQSSC